MISLRKILMGVAVRNMSYLSKKLIAVFLGETFR